MQLICPGLYRLSQHDRKTIDDMAAIVFATLLSCDDEKSQRLVRRVRTLLDSLEETQNGD